MWTLKLAYPGQGADVYLQYKTEAVAKDWFNLAKAAINDDGRRTEISDDFGRVVFFVAEDLRYVALVDVRQDSTGNFDTQLIQAEVRSSAERKAQANPLLRGLGGPSGGHFNG